MRVLTAGRQWRWGLRNLRWKAPVTASRGFETRIDLELEGEPLGKSHLNNTAQGRSRRGSILGADSLFIATSLVAAGSL